jgi:hypothetical protein
MEISRQTAEFLLKYFLQQQLKYVNVKPEVRYPEYEIIIDLVNSLTLDLMKKEKVEKILDTHNVKY